ncbi:MAG: glutamate--tRNA ligase [Desulfurococcales archaeon]|nr:glutamate--tRNA ligase [Desulfurococcales archaeon]
MEDLERLVRGYALKNAVEHGGKAIVGSVVSMIMSDRPDLRPRAREIARLAARIIGEINSMGLEEQKRILEDEYPELARPGRAGEKRAETKRLPPLPGAEKGRVVTRFAPNPDFAMHIGNARPAILSHEYAREYRGKMILRFEDTDPRTKTPIKEAYDLIREDLKWLGVKWDEEHVQSLRMEFFYEAAREALEKGCAYIDLCGEAGRELLREGKYCKTRDNSPEWQLGEFDKMLSGVYGEKEAVVRVKTDPNHPNPSIRDWVALRIIDTSKTPHPLVGDKYIVWPTYNFAVTVDDHLMGVTHVIRAKEHEVNTEKQLFLYKCLRWEPPRFIHIGRLKLEGFILSKSFIRKIMDENPGKFWGFDDPRFGTIAGLRRRGITPEAIREVILHLGVKHTEATLSWANLASINRKILDARSDRIMFVESPRAFRVSMDKCREASIPVHPDRPETRKYRICPGDIVYLDSRDVEESPRVRLLGLDNFSVEKERSLLEMIGGGVEYARKASIPIIQWVPASRAVDVKVLKPEGLELVESRGVAEEAIRNYRIGDTLQFVRYGFIRIDKTGSDVTVIYTHD